MKVVRGSYCLVKLVNFLQKDEHFSHYRQQKCMSFSCQYFIVVVPKSYILLKLIFTQTGHQDLDLIFSVLTCKIKFHTQVEAERRGWTQVCGC